jgi:hypothetical protein
VAHDGCELLGSNGLRDGIMNKMRFGELIRFAVRSNIVED